MLIFIFVKKIVEKYGVPGAEKPFLSLVFLDNAGDKETSILEGPMGEFLDAAFSCC